MKTLTRPLTLTSAVAEAIRDSILHGELLPGEPLKEMEISKSLNTSRGTVREALRQLQQSGLVQIFPFRGAFVTRLTPEKAREIYTLRSLLEPYAVRLAMETNPFTEEDIQKMRGMIKRLGDLEETQDDFFEIVTTDLGFHRLIYEHSCHGLLLEVLNNLQSLTLLFILTTKLYHSDKERDELSHQAVLQGILSGNPDIAEDVLRRHIIQAGDSLVQHMLEDDGLSQ